MIKFNSAKTRCENAICKPSLHNDVSSEFECLETAIVEIDDLMEHERIDKEYCEQLKRQIQKDGVIKRAIAVDSSTRVVLDGHHRLNALKNLGCKRIPAVLVDYNSPTIQVQAWHKDKVNKQTVIEAGMTKNKLPPKTSKHIVIINGTLKHISYIENIVNMPLSELMQDNCDTLLAFLFGR